MAALHNAAGERAHPRTDTGARTQNRRRHRARPWRTPRLTQSRRLVMNSRSCLASHKILRPQCLLCFAGSSHSVNNGPVSDAAGSVRSDRQFNHWHILCTVRYYCFTSLKPNPIFLLLDVSVCPSVRLSICLFVCRDFGPPVAGLVSQHVFCLSFCWLSINPPSVHLGGGHPVDCEGLRCHKVDAVFQHQDTRDTHGLTHTGLNLDGRRK